MPSETQTCIAILKKSYLGHKSVERLLQQVANDRECPEEALGAAQYLVVHDHSLNDGNVFWKIVSR